ncbi:uncharacterized protein LOC128988179 [Macrosteles quadrilineatus]|uniref:uncharacterized protein LOC128988179 n=1 Tax=Macrosteles quadrilineatus TaxID=74068 RepID=UPI0023E0A2E6|nr:uncharacterized protein LOC128988179 [Macrosteles quadrilineatus]
MRTSIVLLSAALAVLLVTPSSLARPSSCSIAKSKSQEASSSSSADASSSEEQIISGNGFYEKKAKEDSSKAVSQNAEKSSESFVSQNDGSGAFVKAQKSKKSSSSSASEASSSEEQVVVRNGGCGCGCKKSVKKELTEAEIKALYCQKKEESLEAYFKRIVAKNEYTSTVDSYIKILNIVRKDFCTLPLWYDIKHFDLVSEYYKALYTKIATETEEAYYSRIIKKEAWETEEQYAKRIILVRDCYPTLSLWTEQKYFEKYTKSVYATCFKKWAKETDEEYVKRIFARDSFFDKSDEIWAKRIFLIQEATCTSSIWYQEKYFDYIKKFYSVYYKQVEKETNEAWLTRVLKPLQGETVEQTIKRISLIKKSTESFGYWKFDFFKKVQASKCFQAEYLSQIQKAFFELTESDIKTIYVQKKDESLDSYFKRIVSKTDYTSTTEAYIKTLNIVRKDFCNLPLWYDIKYFDLVSEYYKTLYTKIATETEEAYYSRIIKKEAWETEEQYAKRIILVRDCYPTLSLWTEQKYFEKYTKSVYATCFKKWAKETDEEYVKRIFARDSFFDKSDEIWAKRIFLIQEATCTSSIWYQEKYFDYIKKFYSVYYKQVEKETNEAWLTRVLKPLQGETVEQTIKRISLIKKSTESFGYWKFDFFKKVQASKCFQAEYLSQIQKAFFELTESDIKTIYVQKKDESLDSYFKRIVSKTDYTSTTEAYIKTLNIVRKDFCNLPLWYDIKYFDLVSEYYKTLYTKIATETEEAYYSRIIKKEAWETEEQYAKRIILVRDCYPTLSLWTEQKYFEKYTKSVYATCFKKWAKETDEEYVKRIFARDSFFDKSDEIWAKRIFLIQEATCTSSIWYQEKYFDYIKKFYSVYYKQVEKETNEAWLTRVLKPLQGETVEQTIKRISLIKKSTESFGYWKFDFFKKVQASKCFQAEYLSQIQKAFFELTESDIKTIYVQKKDESLDSYFKRIVSKTDYTSTTEAYIKTLNIVRKDFCNLPLWYDIKYFDLVSEYYKTLYTKIATETEEAYYSRIIKKEAWETEEQYAKRIILVRDCYPTLSLWTEQKYFEKYTKSVYATCFKKWAKETDEEYVKRIFARDSFFDKSDEIWAKRIFLIQEATCTSSIWYQEKYFDYIKKFYSVYYKQVEKETNEAWLTRVLKPLQGETVEQTIKRISLIKKSTESFGYWKFDFFKKVQASKCFQAEYLSQIQKAFFELTESDIKTIYVQKKDESLDSYFKRIVSKTDYTSTTEAYIKTLNIVRKDFCNLPLWYDIKYFDLVSEYYKTLYTKIATETEEAYYSRIIKKEAWETEEQYAKRIILVRDCYPTLSLWTEQKYFEKYTKSVYATCFKKWAKETDEEYVKRIFARDSFFDKSDEIWAKRIFLIQKATCSSSIWYEEKYFQYLQNFYSLFYKKLEKESSDAWLIRVLKPFEGESFEQAIRRIHLIKKVTENCGCWKAEVFKLIRDSKCFQSEYLCKIEKEFFASPVIYKSEKSKKTSESSSSSSSSSEEQLKANCATGEFEKKSASSQSAASSASDSEENESLLLVRRG